MKNIINEICQSCGMSLKTYEDFGSNSDTSKNTEYCKFCYMNEKFTSEISLNEFIEKQVKLAVEKMNIPADEANKNLPKLNCWKK